MRETFDVVVLGSGAGALTAAIVAHDQGARVAVFEKADKLGGTSAWSGGHVWIPNNPHMAEAGATDSAEEALTYIMSLSRGLIDERLARAYVAAGPEMVRYLDQRAGAQFRAVRDFPDYHPENPGGKPRGGRTVECPLFSYEELGEWAQRVTPSPYIPPHITMSETPLGAAVHQPPSAEELARRAARNVRGCGQSLVGRLLKACLTRGIEPRTEHRGTELLMREGAVAGVRVETPGGEIEVGAGAVILATGGFEWNEAYKRAFLRGPLTHPVSIPTNTGDGLYMAMKAGAMLANMREAWWIPVSELPPGVNVMNRFLVSAERSRAGTIMINREGRRFTNEAANYNALGSAFHHEDVSRFDYANLPCWAVFDQHYLTRFGVLDYPRGEAPPWLIRAPSVRALAETLGVPADALEATIARWNAGCEEGRDPDFRRGESAHDRWWGDPSRKGEVAATLGAISEPPFYAMQIHSGALGTKGGPKTDEHARVVDLDDRPIPGLYAVGNVMASPFGMTYGGAGGTLGPAMVFGYLAGRHAGARAGEHHGGDAQERALAPS